MQSHDYTDPFVAGQMVGMLVILTFMERHEAVPAEVLDKLRDAAANNAQLYFQKPTEDIYLMINDLVEEIHI